VNKSKHKDTVPNCFYRVSVKALILDEQNRFLLTQETNGKWELPGGGLDHGETPQLGLKREILEETGLEAYQISDRPTYLITTTHDRTGTHIINILYQAKLKDLDFTPSRECAALKFFTKEEAQTENLYNNVKAFLEQFDPKNH
jgi:8-oxo-dGTP pyrophosphatase MutT (NUDIX family)